MTHFLLQQPIAATGMHISLVNQPPNSPDTNALDLGYFNATQILQHRRDTTSIPVLVKAVEDSFAELDYVSNPSSFAVEATITRFLTCTKIN
ncbi:hypothetical protein IV203_030630 [Nitzschia inconspicua]|uniref:Uncharacterized protein n=1 Tax=Nitzschia inconspicua TaxID=303405 RepID=A0A9K3PH77_9STRA|nr:hypothetical protein IV203_015968 [Nitzschia inconspicua]KAG7367887.1 hypothetical protein IV203_030630 [Nitzschia inconspicua]